MELAVWWTAARSCLIGMMIFLGPGFYTDCPRRLALSFRGLGCTFRLAQGQPLVLERSFGVSLVWASFVGLGRLNPRGLRLERGDNTGICLLVVQANSLAFLKIGPKMIQQQHFLSSAGSKVLRQWPASTVNYQLDYFQMYLIISGLTKKACDEGMLDYSTQQHHSINKAVRYHQIDWSEHLTNFDVMEILIRNSKSVEISVGLLDYVDLIHSPTVGTQKIIVLQLLPIEIGGAFLRRQRCGPVLALFHQVQHSNNLPSIF